MSETCHVRQCILPPHILEAIQIRGNASQRAMAQGMTLEAERFRAERTFATQQTRHMAAPMAVAARGARSRTFDAKGTLELPGDMKRQEEEGSGDPAADQAHQGARDTYRLFDEVFQRDSLDGNGMELWSTVHYGVRFNNAFWNGRQMVYGDGDGEILKPLTGSLSVIAHELSHGVVQHSGGLIYRDQSGALNESFADIFAMLTVQHKRGESVCEASWLVGEDLLRESIGGCNGQPAALRSLRAPGTGYDDDLLGKDPQPFHMDGYVVTTADHGGVHVNSGIPNHAFYLLAQYLGGRAWEKAGHIWYDTMQGIDDPHANFSSWADRAVEMARNRFGSGSLEVVFTRRAWQMVGVPL